ncbi:DNA damage-binding protein 1-like [Andrographis paniculata]|uniref:DNA damage-binding protein 1-like n=1 Tax=Andrographis paniculata TaxID=175694 RepID=UPI0021E72502|nr:DNA damage-binding protein 1-like [Andrographis paniculata]
MQMLQDEFRVLTKSETKMSVWNYVVTACKPTSVTHSCVGNFTGPQDLNLIVAKCTRLEIHLVTPQGLQSLLDVPIYGRIAMLELFRFHGGVQDLLFIAMEKYKFCILEWDAGTGELMTREIGDVSDKVGRPTDNGQIGIIDPDCRLIGLHLHDGLFKVLPFNNRGQLEAQFNLRLREQLVLDIKFLYGCQRPTIIVLYQDSRDARHVKTYEVIITDAALVEGPWYQTNLDNGAALLIPVPPPFCGVLIIGEETVMYRSASTVKEKAVKTYVTRAYGRFDEGGSRYLLGDQNGLLRVLDIIHEDEKVTGIEIVVLGKTSIASSISYLGNDTVFVGSNLGDSQLIKLGSQPEATCSCIKLLESYVNLAPIVDFCVVDLEKQGLGQVITCSGGYKDGSLCIVRSGIGINEQASIELQGIKGIWSLRSATDDPYDTFLVVSFINETRVLAMNIDDELEESEIEGFKSDVQTLYCHDAVYDQLVQVTSNGVRLVSSITKQLRTEWSPPAGYSVNVATANRTQVLLATGGGYLVYLEIGDSILTEAKRAQLDYDIACLDINPIGDDPNNSQLAAVGLWTDNSVRIFSLPDLTLARKELLGGDIIPRSVLLCTFEGISYLLCALGDGHLLNFELNTRNGKLTNRKKVPLGIQPSTLGIFSLENATHVFTASDRPAIIYTRKNKMIYSNVHLKGVRHMCPFHSAAFPNSIVYSTEDELTIGTIDDMQTIRVRSIPLGETARRICHQEQTRTFAICCWRYNEEDREIHSIRLLDDQTFMCKSTFALDEFECGYSILSCSFSSDDCVYYCVGTAYVVPEETEPTKGRILIFAAGDGRLKLIAEKETKGTVYSLNAFNGKLLAAINHKIQLYKWELGVDGLGELQPECGHHGHVLALYLKSRGDLIVVGDVVRSMSLLIYKSEKGAIEELGRDGNGKWMTAVDFLDEDVYLGTDINYNLFSLRRSSGGKTEERGQLEVVGKYHLGEFVNQMREGSLVVRLPESELGGGASVLFGTVSGVIGLVASLPGDEYGFFERLQTQLRKVIRGVGGLTHEAWRSFCNERITSVPDRYFLDGDLIESFLNLDGTLMEQISGAMELPLEELIIKVRRLTRLH